MDEDAQSEILAALDLEGFFVDPDRRQTEFVSMYGTTLGLDDLPRHYREVELQVMNELGSVIGSYYIGNVEVLAGIDRGRAGGSDLTASFRGYSLPYAYAGKIWRRWAADRSIERGEWKRHPGDEHRSWLHVVQEVWFESGRMATRYGEDVAVMDEGELVNMSSFYCALGEAVHGPGGYFGSNPSAVADCLSPRWPGDAPLRLVWNAKESVDNLADDEDFDLMMTVFSDFKVEIIEPR